MKQCGKHLQKNLVIADYVESSRSVRLVAGALPTATVTVSGSMLLARPSGLPPFVVHVKPVGVHQPDYGARHIAALALIVEPGSQRRIDPGLVARTLCHFSCRSSMFVDPSGEAGGLMTPPLSRGLRPLAQRQTKTERL